MLHVWLVNDISGLVLCTHSISSCSVKSVHCVNVYCIFYFVYTFGHYLFVMLHVWLWCYTCDCDATRVIVRLHVWLWGYTCDCDATRVIVRLHVWLWCYTCDCDATRVIVRLHVWLWGYTCDCEATRVIVWSVVSGFKTVFWIPTNYNTYSYIRYSGLTGSLSSISLLKNERKRN